jgi:hypothetical protein
MIPTSLGLLVFLYTAGLCVAVLALWTIRSLWRRRAAARDRRGAIQCALCGTIYRPTDSSQPLPPCPVCAHPNERTSATHEV